MSTHWIWIAYNVGFQDDVMTWKRFPHYRPVVIGIHWLPVDCRLQSLMFLLFQAWTICWTNSRFVSNMIHHGAHVAPLWFWVQFNHWMSSHTPHASITYLCSAKPDYKADIARVVTKINTLRPRQDGCQFIDDIFKCIFLNENISISIEISLKFIHKGPINNIPALVQIMAWRRLGDKPLSETMMVSLLTHICVTRPQWGIGDLHANPVFNLMSYLIFRNCCSQFR